MSPDEIGALAEAIAPRLAVELGRVAFSIDEASARAGCGRDLLYGELRAGRLRSWTVGSRRFISREALEAWAAEREAAAEAAP